MIRVANVTEKNIRPDPAKVITAAAATSTDVLPDISQNQVAVEFAGRYIQNLSAADMYYAFGQDCNLVGKEYHGILQSKQQLDCSNHGARVSVYSVAGGDIATTVLRRIDMSEHRDPQPSYQLPA